MLHNEAEALQSITPNRRGANVAHVEFYKNVKEMQTSKTCCREYIETLRKCYRPEERE
jgi:hypothetical protein